MHRYRQTIVTIALAVGAVLCVTGASYADDAAQVPTLAMATGENPSGDPVGRWQDDGTGSVTAPPTGNPSDVPGVIDNPVTEHPVDLDAQVAMWLAVLGFISTFIVSIVNRMVPGVSPEDHYKRGVIAFVICLAIGVLDTTIRGTLNLTNAMTSVLIVFTSAIGFYKAWFHPAGIDAKIQGVGR